MVNLQVQCVADVSVEGNDLKVFRNRKTIEAGMKERAIRFFRNPLTPFSERHSINVRRREFFRNSRRTESKTKLSLKLYPLTKDGSHYAQICWMDVMISQNRNDRSVWEVLPN